MADITPISVSRDRPTYLKTLVDRLNSNPHSFDSSRRNEALDLMNTKNVDRVLKDVVEEPLSVLQFLRKILFEELGNGRGRNHKLIVISIHAVLLESGFVGFDPVTNRVIEGFQYQETWPPLFKMSVFYTRPELVSASQGNTIESIVLKFQTLGKCMNVYGSVVGGVSNMVHLIRLDEDQLVPPLNVVWANYGVNENASAGKEVLLFWRDLKDNLTLPLWIDMYEKVGFNLPPCFMKLPSELKLKILEKIRAVDLARISCVCSELNSLAQSDDLWKLKYEEGFKVSKLVCAVNVDFQGSWKKTFARRREEMIEMKIALQSKGFLMFGNPTEEDLEMDRIIKKRDIFKSIVTRSAHMAAYIGSHQ